MTTGPLIHVSCGQCNPYRAFCGTSVDGSADADPNTYTAFDECIVCVEIDNGDAPRCMCEIMK